VSRGPGPSRPDPLAARRAALRVLFSVAKDQLTFRAAFEHELARRNLDGRDRALAHTLAAGSMKLRRRLDFIVNLYVTSQKRPLPAPIVEILRLGAFQLTELERVPRHAAVSTAVELAKEWGHAGTARLVNAVLRRVAEAPGEWPWPPRKSDPVVHLATVHSYPNWIVRRWLADFGEEEAENLCLAGNRPAGTTLRIEGTPADVRRVRETLRGRGLATTDGRWFDGYVQLSDPPALAGLAELHAGTVTVQNEAAAVAVHLLGPAAGETVIEVGAAPGGKATQAAMRVGPSGQIVAIDKSAQRLVRLGENLGRQKIANVHAVRADGLSLPVREVEKILIDAPCSALGLVHRHPELRWSKEIADVERLAELQLQLLTQAFDRLTPGGRLVYSTCTTTRAENEGVIARLLEARPRAAVLDPRPLLPDGVPATAQWVRIPPDPPGLDGAFACLLLRMP
jgi:16S rRNA (cytosine967-C5)-methyltransferase